MCLPAPGPLLPSETTRCGFWAEATVDVRRSRAGRSEKSLRMNRVSHHAVSCNQQSGEICARADELITADSSPVPVSKREPNRALHDARVARRRRLAELGIHLLPASLNCALVSMPDQFTVLNRL